MGSHSRGRFCAGLLPILSANRRQCRTLSKRLPSTPSLPGGCLTGKCFQNLKRLLSLLITSEFFLNKVQATSDFIYVFSKPLLCYADLLAVREGQEDVTDNQLLPETEAARLILISQARTRKCMLLFNSSDSVNFCLAISRNVPKQGNILYCVM